MVLLVSSQKDRESLYSEATKIAKGNTKGNPQLFQFLGDLGESGAPWRLPRRSQVAGGTKMTTHDLFTKKPQLGTPTG